MKEVFEHAKDLRELSGLNEEVEIGPELVDAAIVRMVNSLVALNVPGLSKLELNERLDRWSAVNYERARKLVVAAAGAMERKEITFEINSGPQGTGKGTQTKALDAASRDLLEIMTREDSALAVAPAVLGLANSRALGTMEVVTGTGGIMVPPKGESEYRTLFGQVGPLMAGFTKEGLLVPDSLTSTLVLSMVAKRILQGASVVQLDLWPRSDGQNIHRLELFDELAAEGITARFEVVDMRLMNREAITKMETNKAEYIDAGTRLGKYLQLVVEPAMKYFEAAGIQSADVSGVLETLIEKYETIFNDQPSQDLIYELRVALRRISGRARAEGRADDSKWSANVARLRSYLLNTMPFVLLLPEAKIVAADQLPDAVAKELVGIKTGEMEGSALADLAASHALRIVSGLAQPS